MNSGQGSDDSLNTPMQDDDRKKSRTQIKKEAEELQKFGVELSKLPVPRLKRMDLPDDLKKALIDAKSITSHVAGKRHRQYIGALMRDMDQEKIHQSLQQARDDVPVESVIAQETQVWMDRLLTGGDGDIEEFLNICPELDRQQLRQLLRNVKKEKANGKSSKSCNKLKQVIRKSL